MPSTPSFVKPNLHQPTSLPELYDWHYTNNRDFPLFSFDDGQGSVRTISMGEGVQGIHRATQLIRHHAGIDPPSDDTLDLPVIAILAASESTAYFCSILGVLRTGRCAFPISPRNSASAVAFLLAATKATTLLISADAFVHDLLNSSLELLDSDRNVKIIPMPTFEDLFPEDGFDPAFQLVASRKTSVDARAFIYHSSGTTSNPNPIFLTHRVAYWLGTLPSYGETQIMNSTVGYHSVPMFHGMGLTALAWAAAAGITIAVFRPQHPAIPANPTNTFDGLLATNADYAFMSPLFLEEWVKSTHYIEEMRKMKGIIYGGGPLDKSAGDLLASKGVNVYLAYGTTQTAILSEFLPKPQGMNWDYFKVSPNRLVLFEKRAENEFEIIVPVTDTFWPNVLNTTVNGRQAFATSDLVSPHPTKPGHYKLIGRLDDQVIHSTGKKTNPGPSESVLNQHPNVEASILFGRGRPQCGILIQPVKKLSSELLDPGVLAEFTESVWPAIERLNKVSPNHSRIAKEMILVTSPSEPFQYTAKGTLRRQYILDQYAREIDELYHAAAEKSNQSRVAQPRGWSQPSVASFIRAIIDEVTEISNNVLDDDADLFEHGLDSLQATQIRNTITRVLRKSHPTAVLAISLVYDFPTISSLAEYIATCVAEIGEWASRNDGSRLRKLHALVEKYTETLPNFSHTGKGSANERADNLVVLLTGGTGSLGSNVLTHLISTSRVSRVFVLSPSSHDGEMKERLSKTLKQEGLREEVLSNPKTLLLPGDASRPCLGLDDEIYSQLQSSVTHIIHSGWKVNFNNAISSFSGSIRSVRNLIDFSLGGSGTVPARIIFVSSIGLFRNTTGDFPAKEEHVLTPDGSLGTGYTESKWVAEEILRVACKKTSLKSTIVRPTQLTGGPNGSWKTSEWFPSLIKSSVALGKLPDVKGTASWLRTDVAATTIVDALHTEEPVLHIAHPRPVAWSSLMTKISRKLQLPVVTYEEWLDALETADGDLNEDFALLQDTFTRNPALRLLKFFKNTRDHSGEDTESFGVSKLSIDKARTMSASLRDAEPLGAKDVASWIDYWKRSGFL